MRHIKFAIATILLLGTCADLRAIPAGFNIQGRLTDASGINKTDTFTMKFSIYASTDLPTAAPVWWETKEGVAVANGNFQVVLQGERLEAAVKDLAGAEVEITVGNDPPMVPRQPLLRSPFSASDDLVGSVMWFYRISCPEGFLYANGGQITENEFPKLAFAMGKTGTFNLPDLRGEFIRGVDDRINDPKADSEAPRVVGSTQTFQVESHRHGTDMYGPRPAYGTANQFITVDPYYGVMRYTTDYGGKETRPRNVALLPCIKH